MQGQGHAGQGQGRGSRSKAIGAGQVFCLVSEKVVQGQDHEGMVVDNNILLTIP